MLNRREIDDDLKWIKETTWETWEREKGEKMCEGGLEKSKELISCSLNEGIYI